MQQVKINAYICSKLHVTITRECEEGVTPFMIECPKKGCDAMAKSQGYQVEQSLEASYEWYKPSGYDGLTESEIEHVKKGGLLLRKIED